MMNISSNLGTNCSGEWGAAFLLIVPTPATLFGRLPPGNYTALPTGAEPRGAWEFPFPQGPP